MRKNIIIFEKYFKKIKMAEKYRRLLETTYKFYTKYFPDEVDHQKYREFLENIDSYNLDNDKTLFDIYYDFSSFFESKNYVNEEFYLKFCDKFLFLDEYNGNVKKFFKVLIKSNNIHQGIFSDDENYFLSFLKDVDDLIQVYECLYKNPFLLIGNEIEITQLEKEEKINFYKIKKLSQMSKREDKNIVLNFIFTDRTESININSIFLTDWYFNNSFSQDIYNFHLDYEYDENFLKQIIGYLKGWNIDLNMDQNVLEKIFDFSDMYCMNELHNLLIEEEEIEEDFFKRQIVDNGFYNYVIFMNKKYILDKENYFIDRIPLEEQLVDTIYWGKNFGNPKEKEFFEKNEIKYSNAKIQEFALKNNLTLRHVF